MLTAQYSHFPSYSHSTYTYSHTYTLLPAHIHTLCCAVGAKMVVIEVQPEYGYCVLVAVGSSFMLVWKAMKVSTPCIWQPQDNTQQDF